jgi:hypothetical protein
MKSAKGLKAPTPRKKTSKIETLKPATLETPQAATGASARSAAKPVTIEAKVDVGFGNAVYLRGEGSGLSWSQGIPLICVNGSTWKWSGEVKDPLKFKLLLNDTVWAQGEDIVVTPGEKVEVTPYFS